MRRREFISGVGAAAWPFLVSAQQQTKLTIGTLSVPPLGDVWPEVAEGFRRGLAEVGFAEGRNVTIERLSADGHIERLPALAADLVHSRLCGIGSQSSDAGHTNHFLCGR